MTFPFLAGSPIKTGDMPRAVHAFDDTAQVNIGSATPHPGTPEVSVNFTAPPAGYILGAVGGGIRDNVGNNRGEISLEIRENDVNGDIVQQANSLQTIWTNNSFTTGSTVAGYGSRIFIAPVDPLGIITPLTPGANYFARVMQSAGVGTATDVDILHRDITIVPLPLGAAVGSKLVSNLDNPRPAAGGTQVTSFNISNSHGDWQPTSTNAQLQFIAPNSGRAIVIVAGGLRDNTNNNRVGLAPQLHEDDENGRILISLNTVTNRQRYMWTNNGNTENGYQYGCRLGWYENLEPGRQYFIQTVAAATSAPSASADIFNQRLIVIGVS